MEIESGRHCEYDNDTITVLAMLAMIRCRVMCDVGGYPLHYARVDYDGM